MHNYGLTSFMQAKKLKSKECIDGFLQEQGITTFNSKNHNQVNTYIQENWEKFCSFVDRGLKNKTLHGQRVKLNSYFDEQKQYKEAVRAEFEALNLTQEQKKLLSYIRHNGASQIHSFLQKNGYSVPKKEMSYHSKTLRFLPIVDAAIAAGFEIKTKENDV